MNDLFFIDNDDFLSSDRSVSNIRPWKLLIVDDDDEIHSITRLVLDGIDIDGYPLEFLSAYSAEEARDVFEKHDDIAIALIDVVMESDHAGLDLVRWIREVDKNHSTRLILRTGQPGSAPEESVIKDYDINDYKSKTELTAAKLKTITYSAIRSYRDILIIKQHRNGLQKVIEATDNVLKSRTLPHFGSAVLAQIIDLLNLERSALYLSIMTEDLQNNQSFNVLAATGDLVESLAEIGDLVSSGLASDKSPIPESVRLLLMKSLEEKRCIVNSNYYVGYYPTDSRSVSLLYVEHNRPLSEFEMHLLEVFAASIALTYSNLVSKENLLETQKELIFIISDAIEQRSLETGFHVKRTALICQKIAQKMGLESDLIDAIRLASPLHDLGKIGIPDSILHKPGKLNSQEWDIMRNHVDIGHNLLTSSQRVISKIGAEIAWTHHERWDGHGYPRQLKGKDIPLLGRIMAIADVFDALGSKRCYKKAWPNEKMRKLIESERGKHFDPEITDIFLNDFDEFCAIREAYPDKD